MFVNFFNSPTKLKFKKFQKSSTYNKNIRFSYSKSLVSTGTSFLKAISCGRLSINHLEAARKVIKRKMKKIGSLKVYVFPYVCTTHKPLAVRMGKGKGNTDKWVFPVRAGSIIFELNSAPAELSYEALLMASKKLPIYSKIIYF